MNKFENRAKHVKKLLVAMDDAVRSKGEVNSSWKSVCDRKIVVCLQEIPDFMQYMIEHYPKTVTNTNDPVKYLDNIRYHLQRNCNEDVVNKFETVNETVLKMYKRARYMEINNVIDRL